MIILNVRYSWPEHFNHDTAHLKKTHKHKKDTHTKKRIRKRKEKNGLTTAIGDAIPSLLSLWRRADDWHFCGRIRSRVKKVK